MNDILSNSTYSKCDMNCLEDKLPKNWRKVFEKKEFVERKEKMIELWKDVCGEELSLVINFLQQNLLDIELVKNKDIYSVLYKFKNDKNEILYYQGVIPNEKNDNMLLEKLPQEVSKFYKYLHNGFFEFNYPDTGIISIENVECLDDYEWGVIEDLNLHLNLDLSTSYSLFSSGAGGYVVIDLNKKSLNEAIIWFAKKEPLYDRMYWDFVDEWLLMCMN